MTSGPKESALRTKRLSASLFLLGVESFPSSVAASQIRAEVNRQDSVDFGAFFAGGKGRREKQQEEKEARVKFSAAAVLTQTRT